jgi:hypothetical protein
MTYSTPNYVSPFDLDREMSYTYREFFNMLPGPLAGYEYEIKSNSVLIELGKGTVHIQVGEERNRRFTNLVSFPILPVKIQFSGVDPCDESKFLRKFDFHYMKGLG